MQFDQPNILPELRTLAAQGGFDQLDFGVISFDAEDTVTQYNAFESNAAGLSQDQVIGKNFFIEVAPCMNNFMVSERFDEEENLDETIDYVLTLKMRPTKVKLRLLRSAESEERFVLLKR
ncbi:MAG: PAS domain-containing protein [Pseudomonadota bacterium]